MGERDKQSEVEDALRLLEEHTRDPHLLAAMDDFANKHIKRAEDVLAKEVEANE